ncbi:MAG: LysR family transcriptional regulator [Halieaceae bacterium]|jgi:DNA-binding transcriptional LysR family regulator|nr:LysR family transcriptional regulator [Halieaceae bacterium]
MTNIKQTDISVEQMRAFKAVAETGSFSQAAELTFRTQSAVSSQIKNLEQSLGEVLFARSTRSLSLTDAGEIFLAYAEQILNLLSESAQAIRDLKHEISGKLVISTSDTSASYRLPPLVKLFQERYPNIELVIRNDTSTQTLKAVDAGEADLGIATLKTSSKNITVLPLFQKSDCLICHPDHPLAKRKSVLLKDLEQYPILLLGGGSSTRREIDSACEQAKVKLNVRMALSSIEVAKNLVQVNSGISIVPEVSITEELRQRKLVKLPISDFQNSVKEIGLIQHKKRYQSRASEAFTNLCREQLSQQ